MEVVDKGDSVELTFETTDADGAYADPDSLTLKVIKPDGSELNYTYQIGLNIQRIDVGRFKCVVLGDMRGEWEFTWTGTGNEGDTVESGSFYVREKKVLIVRNANNKLEANTWATMQELHEIAEDRPDAAVWFNAPNDVRENAVKQAYYELARLTWSAEGPGSQSKDYEFRMRFYVNDEPPMDDEEFVVRIKRAQVAQAIYILTGTQVRDMAREGIRMSRALSGSEMEFTGYLGPVCAEALEILGPYVEIFPRFKRMA